jgi:4-hydroxythreonine-4-phosphate dehydrogenase
VTPRSASRAPRIVVTLGDPRGIGPEVVARALADATLRHAAAYRVIGPEGVPRPEGVAFESIGTWSPGEPARLAGALAGQAIERAVAIVLEGGADALVTAPIHKPALQEAGYPWPGHTEMLRDLVQVPTTALCLAAEHTAFGGALRVVLVSGHIPLREVPDAVTVGRLVECGLLARDALRRFWGIDAPRLALCGLNPHASDGGLFGDEEERVYVPALATLRGLDVVADGPFPADTVFVRAARGEFDGVLAPYHDVGMAAIKSAAFGEGVNVTLGLPFPRTSPDHGTAFDIAGTGRADPTSMARAIALAVRFAQRVRAEGPAVSSARA